LTKDDEPSAPEGDRPERCREILEGRAIPLEDLVCPEARSVAHRRGLDLGEAPADQVEVADEEERTRTLGCFSAVALRSTSAARTPGQKSSTIAL
jgi:hypothetical protein